MSSVLPLLIHKQKWETIFIKISKDISTMKLGKQWVVREAYNEFFPVIYNIDRSAGFHIILSFHETVPYAVNENLLQLKSQ